MKTYLSFCTGTLLVGECQGYPDCRRYLENSQSVAQQREVLSDYVTLQPDTTPTQNPLAIQNSRGRWGHSHTSNIKFLRTRGSLCALLHFLTVMNPRSQFNSDSVNPITPLCILLTPAMYSPITVKPPYSAFLYIATCVQGRLGTEIPCAV